MKAKFFAGLVVALAISPVATALANGGGAGGAARMGGGSHGGGSGHWGYHGYGGYGYNYGGFSYGESLPYYDSDSSGPIHQYNGQASDQEAGSVNAQVQLDLTQLGYYHGPIDGNVAPASPTAVAITAYQRDHKLPVTGLINGGLLSALSGG